MDSFDVFVIKGFTVTFLFFLQYKVFEHYSDLNLDDEIIGFCESDFVELKLHLF